MRESLKNLLGQSIALQYKLPSRTSEGREIPCTHITTSNDDCLNQIGSNDAIAKLIYNGIVEYAYNDEDITPDKLDNLQLRALQGKLKYNPNAAESTQLGYGFQGEVMLHLLLEHCYHAGKCIARGYMFSALENAETKGYDSYLMVEDGATLYLYFGEAKFYIAGYKASLKPIFENINKALSDDYLNRNFVAMDNQYEHLIENSRIPAIIDKWRNEPLINMAVSAHEHNMHLVYPMLVIFDDKAATYDQLILDVVNHINEKYGTVHASLTIPYTLFFMFLPVDNSKEIKKQVLQWISQGQPLMQ